MKTLALGVQARKARRIVHRAFFGLAVWLLVASAQAEIGDGGETGSSGGRASSVASAPPASVGSEPAPVAEVLPQPALTAPPAPMAEPEPAPSSLPAVSAAGGRAVAVAGHAGQPAAPAATEPRPAPALSASAQNASVKSAAVRLGDTMVFFVRSPLGGRSPEERARGASRALAATVEDPKNDVRIVRQDDVAVIYVGAAPVIQLTATDAQLAGDGSLDVHAANVATSVRQALVAERQRSRVAKNVFSLSLVVFFALIAFYLMKKIGDVTDRARLFVDERGDHVLAIRVQKIELVRPAVLKSTALVGLWVGKWLGQFGVLYAWLVIVLSLFESTRGYTERLTGFVVTPLSQLMQRLAMALPLLVVAGIAALSVFVLLRFVALFFAGVARRETALDWLPPDLAAPTSVLIRIGIVVAALVFAAPVVTGDPDGALGRAGAIALIAMGLSAIPLLATGLVGVVVLFGRRLRVGEHVSLSGSIGRISSINLFEMRLQTSERLELRIPHLVLLRVPLKGLGTYPRVSIELAVAAECLPTRVIPVLDQAAGRVGRDVGVEVVGADIEGVVYRVSVTCDSLDARSQVALLLLEALAGAGFPLGRSPRGMRST